MEHLLSEGVAEIVEKVTPTWVQEYGSVRIKLHEYSDAKIPDFDASTLPRHRFVVFLLKDFIFLSYASIIEGAEVRGSDGVSQ